mgnify:CR=1 FL=1
MKKLRGMLPRLISVLILVEMVVLVLYVGFQANNSNNTLREVMFSDDGYDFKLSTNVRKYDLKYIDSGFELYDRDTKLLDGVIVRDGVQYFDLEASNMEGYSGFTYKDCYKTIEADSDGRSVVYIKMPSGTVVRLITESDLDLSAIDVKVTEQITTEETVEQ